MVKGARSATMMYSYLFTLASRAVVATFDLSAQHLGALVAGAPRADHWLSDERNVLLLWLEEEAWVRAPQRDPRSPPRPLPVAQRQRVDPAFEPGQAVAGPLVA